MLVVGVLVVGVSQVEVRDVVQEVDELVVVDLVELVIVLVRERDVEVVRLTDLDVVVFVADFDFVAVRDAVRVDVRVVV